MKDTQQNTADLDQPKLVYDVKTTVMYNGMPVIGSPDLLQKAVQLLSCNYEGKVQQVLNYGFDKVHMSFLEPGDKGTLSLFGVDQEGNVIFGCCYYPREGLLVIPRESCNVWYDYNEKTGVYK